MKTNLVQRLILLSALLLAALPVGAEPLKPAYVIANPDWLIHLDFDQLKKTRVGEFLLAEMEKPEATNKLAAFQAIFNFDPRRSIRGLTLYGQGTSPSDAILLVLGQFDADRLVTLAKGAQDHQSQPHRTYTIHSWIDKNMGARARGDGRTYGAIHPSGTVIFGQKEARVAQALDVLDQAQPSLQGKKFVDDITNAGGNAFLVAATLRPELPSSDPNAALLKRTRSVSLTLRQAEENLIANLSLQAEDQESAQQILTVGQGLTALLTMQTDNPEATALAQGLGLAQEGEKVRVSLKLPNSKVIQLMQKRENRRANER